MKDIHGSVEKLNALKEEGRKLYRFIKVQQMFWCCTGLEVEGT